MLELHPPSRLGVSGTFPPFSGGDVAVLAEYWLRTYERIEKDVAGISSVAYVKHREFVDSP